jgi:hypothetical protein
MNENAFDEPGYIRTDDYTFRDPDEMPNTREFYEKGKVFTCDCGKPTESYGADAVNASSVFISYEGVCCTSCRVAWLEATHYYSGKPIQEGEYRAPYAAAQAIAARLTGNV